MKNAAESEASEETATEFTNNWLGVLEHDFRKRFGPRWTPEVQQLYQAIEAAALASARAMDIKAESQQGYRLLSNAPNRGRG